MQPARLLKQKIARGDLVTGVLATNHVWPELVEISQRAGLDYLIVDLEHGPHSLSLVADVCTAGRHLHFPVLVRPLNNDYATLRSLIDQGPAGFLLADVESAAALDRVAEAIRLPPRGRRRPGGAACHWVSNFGLDAWQREIEDDFIVLPQIESQIGVSHAAEIAAHELTTALAVGPYDLSADLGVCGVMDHPDLKATLAQLKHTAASIGKAMWMIGNAEQLARDGWRFLCIGEPTYLLQAALKTAVAHATEAACDG